VSRDNSEDVRLRDLVNKNYISKVDANKKPRPDLLDNFNWILMRARRSKKLTMSQLAKEISESEVAIKMAEEGVLPEDDYRLVNKLESFLGVKIVKDISKKEKENEVDVARVLSFDPVSMKELTIDDMKRLKQQKESEVFSGGEIEEEMEGDEVIIVGDNEVLSDEEIDDILFRG
jgi:ribosome-binding protein aMBF1 (putative translation factor)